MFWPIENLYDADLIIKSDEAIYLCFLNPRIAPDPRRETAITAQPCWRLVKIVETESEGKTVIQRLYPNGDAYNYAYAPEGINTYTFEYRR